MTSNQNNISSDSPLGSFNLKKTIMMYLKKWPWFILSCLVCLSVAFIKLRYTTPQYAATSKIMILDEKERNVGSSALNDLSVFSDKEDAKIEDEIQVIKSRNFLQNIIKRLDLNVQFFTKGRVYESELYKSSPVEINFIASDSVIHNTNFNFYIDILSSTTFNYRIHEDDAPQEKSFGEKIPSYFGGFILTPRVGDVERYVGHNGIRVKITPIIYLAESLKYRLYIFPDGKSSKVLNITMEDPIREKAKNIINTLVDEYNKSTIIKKEERATKTANFIDNRVELIALDLVSADSSVVRFKTGNKVTDVASEAGQYLSSSVLNEQQLDVSRAQFRQLNFIEESLKGSEEYAPLPSNLGMGDAAFGSLSSRYNEIIAKREELLKSAGSKNPTVLKLDQTLKGIKQNLNSSIQNSKKSLGIQIGGLESLSKRIDSKIFGVPGQTNKLRSIERERGTKENLYLYLLQKREEALISQTDFSSNIKVIDAAYSLGGPVSPNKKIMYIGALFIGLFIPFGFIYVKDLLDTKIHNKEDLESVIKNMTVLGEIPRVKEKGAKQLVERNDRSILSESFRIIRTNFDYIRRGRKVDKYDNVIFVTSTINGEGKSFFSTNMALTLANTDKRVLLIGADIRNPKILEGLKNKKDLVKVGLTEYLVDKSVLVGEAINTYEINGNKIDVLLSGKVPPNPAELLMSDRMEPLFDKVSAQYDYVIVDTAPSMLVTDTLLFSQFAGHTIYLTRADYTEKRILNFAKELHAEKKLNGMMLVVNDVKQSNFGYGAKYGYYGAKKKKGFFRKSS